MNPSSAPAAQDLLTAIDLWQQALAWLHRHYADYRFYVERDVVWTVQIYLQRRIDEAGLNYRVYNDHPMLPGPRRNLSADLAIVDAVGTVAVAVEFKYEPAHGRSDILKQKLPVVAWSEVGKDVYRIHEFVALGKAGAAYAVFIDEGGAFRHRQPPDGALWQDWGDNRWVLLSQVSASHDPH